MDESRGTRTPLQARRRPESRVARGLSKGLKWSASVRAPRDHGDDYDFGLPEARDARREDRRRRGFPGGPQSLIQVADRLRAARDQVVLRRRPSLVHEGRSAGTVRRRGDELPFPPDRPVHVRSPLSRGRPGRRPRRAAPFGLRGGLWFSDRLSAGASSSSGPVASSSTATRSSSRREPGRASRPWRSLAVTSNSERPWPLAWPASSTKRAGSTSKPKNWSTSTRTSTR